jgi:uncharacterized protein (DUF952 family)
MSRIANTHKFWVRLQRKAGRSCYLHSNDGDDADAFIHAEAFSQILATATGLMMHGSFDTMLGDGD